MKGNPAAKNGRDTPEEPFTTQVAKAKIGFSCETAKRKPRKNTKTETFFRFFLFVSEKLSTFASDSEAQWRDRICDRSLWVEVTLRIS